MNRRPGRCFSVECWLATDWRISPTRQPCWRTGTMSVSPCETCCLWQHPLTAWMSRESEAILTMSLETKSTHPTTILEARTPLELPNLLRRRRCGDRVVEALLVVLAGTRIERTILQTPRETPTQSQAR